MTASQLVLPFVLDKHAGVVVVGVTLHRDATTVELSEGTAGLQLELSLGDNAATTNSPDATAVDINGARGVYDRPGVYGVEQHSPAVQWEYAPGSWALLVGAGEPGLLKVARAIRFSGTTPVSSVVRLTRAPAGATLTGIFTVYPDKHSASASASAPPAPGWQTEVTYTPADGSDTITVSVNTSKKEGRTSVPGMIVGTWMPDATGVEVAGHHGYWSPRQHALSLEFGVDRYVNVEGWAQQGATSTLTLQQAVAVAKTLRLASQPLDRASWFDARTALPAGS